MQYTKAPYVITEEEEDNRIRDRKETFIRETGTEKTYHFQPPKESGHFRSRSFSVIKDFRLTKYPSIL